MYSRIYGQRKTSAPGPGFLGSTSSSADYIGAQRQHGFHQTAEDEELGSNGNAELFPVYPQHQIDAGAAILAHFFEFPFFESFITDNRQNYCGVTLISPWITFICDSMRTDLYEPLLQSWERNGGQSLQHGRIVEHLARRVFRNTSSALDYDGRCSLEHYASLFTGENLRWEAVGMFFAGAGLGAINVRRHARPQSSGDMNSRQRALLARRLLEAGQICLSFCERTGHMIDPEIWLSYSLSLLASVVEGDSSHKTWRQLGDAISTCFAMGLHSEKAVSDQVPFWLSELRKRTFAQIYNIDKVVSPLLGRPPRLCRRYCAMQLPLDLEDSYLSLPRDQLEAKVNLLDADGWNRDSSLRGSAFTRALLICQMVRDDILELSLTTLPQDEDAISRDIWQRSRDAWESLPQWLRVVPDSIRRAERDTVSYISLDFQYNDFLLERTMVRRLHRPSTQLCRIARELLQLTLREIAKKDDVGGDTQNVSWMITQYGLPAAGVLALELLEHSQAGLRSPEHLPRSEVIQNLSRLIAYIKPLVPQEDANYVLCDQARRVTQRILDQILEPRPSDESEVADIPEESWLPGAQSEADFWINLPEHPLLATSRY